MATRTLTLDPITRIEGHLRIDAEVTDHRVTRAWASAQMWRGIESILLGRPPEDAWTFAQRFCGICTTVHALASIRAVEHALHAPVPVNAQHIRNLMIAQHAVQDHIVHFYHLTALDWVDLPSALQADPAATARLAQSLSEWPGNSATEFKAVQSRLRALVDTGRLGLFASGYWGHPAMRLSPELNLLALSHYLAAFDCQRKAAQAVAILGGKNPHIQNLVVGGVATAINVDNLATLNLERLAALRSLLDETRAFVEQVYYPDLLALAGAYKDWFQVGSGVRNYLAVPEFPQDTRSSRFSLPGAIIPDADLQRAQILESQRDPRLIEGITESTARAWYQDHGPQHPWQGSTTPQTPEFQADAKYTWCKAPRFEGRPYQVGPLAQILAGCAAGHVTIRRWVDEANARLGITLADYHSTMGRLLARGLRARLMSELSSACLDALIDNLARGDSSYAEPVPTPPGEFQGVGFHEAPRGALSHWVVIRDRKIANYQAVVPTTWNSSPRDEQGAPGPYEAALEGTALADPEKPLEILRTIHSFDPCIACAVHTIDPEGHALTNIHTSPR